MRLTLQTYFNSEWHHADTLELKDDAAGFQGASIVDYDLDYFVSVASAEFAAGKTVHDYPALSVRYPVDLENRCSRSWPPFLLDFIPKDMRGESLPNTSVLLKAHALLTSPCFCDQRQEVY